MSDNIKRVRRGHPLTADASRSAKPSPQVKAIEASIRAGVDVRETDKNGVTILHRAVRFRSPSAVRSLLVVTPKKS
jgi:ankyrin repeat protein